MVNREIMSRKKKPSLLHLMCYELFILIDRFDLRIFIHSIIPLYRWLNFIFEQFSYSVLSDMVLLFDLNVFSPKYLYIPIHIDKHFFVFNCSNLKLWICIENWSATSNKWIQSLIWFELMIEYQKRLYYENSLNDDDLCNLTIWMYPNIGHACIHIYWSVKFSISGV